MGKGYGPIKIATTKGTSQDFVACFLVPPGHLPLGSKPTSGRPVFANKTKQRT